MIYWLKTHYLLGASKVIFHSRGAVVWDRMDWKQTVVLYLHLCVLTTRAGLSPVRGSAVTRYGRKCKCESAHVVKSVGEKDKAAIVTRATHPSLATDIRARARTYIIAIYIRGLRVFLLLRFFFPLRKKYYKLIWRTEVRDRPSITGACITGENYYKTSPAALSTRESSQKIIIIRYLIWKPKSARVLRTTAIVREH